MNRIFYYSSKLTSALSVVLVALFVLFAGSVPASAQELSDGFVPEIPVLPVDFELDESCYLPIVIADEPYTFDESPIVVTIPEYKAPAYKVPVTIFEVKTNLLADAASVHNVEIELPIARRFSLVLEDAFPWFEYGNKYCLQLWEMGAEARFWFKSWSSRSADKLRGFFAGVYGMSGKYDFQYNTSLDYQGEFWSAGVSGGWSVRVSHWALLEFSLGLGYLRSDWRHYLPTDSYDKLIRDRNRSGSVSFVGPTKAKVSLCIPIDINFKARRTSHE